MSAIPGDLDTSAAPPTTVPLRHFVVALGFLAAGVLVGVADGRVAHLAQVHLLLAGWVCLTIMGAMTQFVPVWAGIALYSRRLAAVQLPLAATGFGGLAVGFLIGVPTWLPVAGLVALAGVWLFVYNVARTLARPAWDVTLWHFAVALGSFVLVTGAGVGLALDHAVGWLPVAGVSRAGLLAAHATLAVYGAVLATVAGALAQLVPMFTQAPTDFVGRTLQRVETGLYPVGVGLLAGGRLLGHAPVARLGGLLVAAGLAAVALVLARRLVRSTREWSPVLTRYAVATVSLSFWAPLAGVSWWQAPLDLDGLFGHPATGSLLLVGGVGFVLFGTLYHVVPFLVWIDRYSDRLGFESVPMIDDLYDRRLAMADGVSLCGAATLALTHEALGGPALLATLAGCLAALGVGFLFANVAHVLVSHRWEPATWPRG